MVRVGCWSGRILCFFALAAAALGIASAAPPALVDLRVNGDALMWAPLGPYESVVLTVSDPYGEVRTVRLGLGSVPSWPLFTSDGLPIPDGLYTWEIRMTARDASGKAKRLVESGHFRITEGKLVPFDLEEPPDGGGQGPIPRGRKAITAPDQVVPDDLIVDGKGCLGLGCAPNEVFGAEALRLKQALLRLRFEDTSVGNFASREWQLRINEPGASAANLFAIEELDSTPRVPFTIMGGAPTNSIFVDAAGKVGFGTGTPGANLHIYGNAGADVFNSVGPDPGSNALNFGYSGSTFGSNSAFFNVRPMGATGFNPALYFATGDVDRMMIDNQGFIAVHMDGALGNNFNPAHPIHSQTSGAHLTAGGIWTNASSRDLKEEIRPLGTEAALEALQGLEAVSFRYKLEPEDGHVGFIAEEVPELVSNPDRRTLSPMDIVAVLTKVVQELTAQNEDLAGRVAALESAVCQK